MPWNGSWNEQHRHSVRCVSSGHIPETFVQAERSLRRSGPLLIRGFGVRVPGGAPALNCGNSLFRPAIMAWHGTNSIRRFNAQDDHSAQPLLTHSDRTASSTGAMPVRPTEPVPPNRVAIVTGLGGGICRYLCDTVGLTSPERLAASPVGTVDAPTRPPGRRRHP